MAQWRIEKAGLSGSRLSISFVLDGQGKDAVAELNKAAEELLLPAIHESIVKEMGSTPEVLKLQQIEGEYGKALAEREQLGKQAAAMVEATNKANRQRMFSGTSADNPGLGSTGPSLEEQEAHARRQAEVTRILGNIDAERMRAKHAVLQMLRSRVAGLYRQKFFTAEKSIALKQVEDAAGLVLPDLATMLAADVLTSNEGLLWDRIKGMVDGALLPPPTNVHDTVLGPGGIPMSRAEAARHAAMAGSPHGG